MKVLHYSDQSDQHLKELFLQADVLFATGDLTSSDFAVVEEELKTLPSFGVYGNHCTPGYLEKLGIINVHLKVYQWNNLLIAGYQGCLRYKAKGGPQFTEEEAASDLAHFPQVDILLLHAAPFGLLDTPGDDVHTGSKSVRQYVDTRPPKYIFCGHDSPSAELVTDKIKIFRTHQAKLIKL